MVDPHDPLWTLDQLCERVAAVLAVGYSGQSNGRVSDLPDRQTIRVYMRLGLVDRAIWRRGRLVYYTMRHLLQVVAIKRLQADGASLAEIRAQLPGLTDASLWEVAQLRLVAGVLEDDPQAECYWNTAIPAPRPTPPPGVLIGVPLEPGVMLLLKSSRYLNVCDGPALQVAAAPLLQFLHVNGFVGGEGATSSKGDTQ